MLPFSLPPDSLPPIIPVIRLFGYSDILHPFGHWFSSFFLRLSPPQIPFLFYLHVYSHIILV